MKIYNHIIPILFFIALFYTIVISVFRQNNNAQVEWKRNIFGDGAGYYSYLPFTFIYGYKTDNLPENIEQKTGYGFYIENEKIKTKYTSGVAILQSPFFFLIHSIEKIRNKNADGFFGLYHYIPFIAAWFYGLLGLMFLFLFLKKFLSVNAAIISIALIFWGTNLYYYIIEYASMSHVYSFFLFSLFIYLSYLFHQFHKTKHFILLCFTAALIVLIRPTNGLFIGIFFIIEHLVKNKIDIRNYLKIKNIIIACAAVAIVFAPQIIYWMYLSGKPFYYSYEKESFSNWASPMLKEFLFSPNNGLFTYNPIWIFLFLSILVFAFKKNVWAISTLILTSIIIYLGASWHDWTFGCSYGSRTLIEYTALFALPTGLLLEKYLFKKSIAFKALLIAILFMLVLTNIQLTQKYERCFFGKNEWDWKYFTYLLRPWGYEKTENINQIDFKTDEYIGNLIITKSEVDNYSYHLKINVETSFEIKDDSSEIYLVLATEGSGDDINYQWPINKWSNNFKTTAILPPKGGNWDKCKLYVWNKSLSPLRINQLKIKVV
ncbi:MAG: hypothetical protein ACK4IK_03225 [Bacteroidia bacterium]